MRKVRIIILFFIVSTFCQDALILKSPIFGISPYLLIKAVSPTNYVYTINTVPNPLKAAIDYVDRDPSCSITFPPVNVNITITKPDNSTSTFTVINYSDGNIDIPFTGGTIGTYNVVAFIDTYTYPEFNGYATASFQIEIDNDRDNDGIPDSKDACPDNPEDKDGIYDDDGCPETDGDNDGIVDESDNCPTSSEDYDGFNDSDGCPDPVNIMLTVEENVDGECMEGRNISFSAVFDPSSVVGVPAYNLKFNYLGADGVTQIIEDWSWDDIEEKSVAMPNVLDGDEDHYYTTVTEATLFTNEQLNSTSNQIYINVYKLWIKDVIESSENKTWYAVVGEPFESSANASKDCIGWVWDMYDNGIWESVEPVAPNYYGQTATLQIRASKLPIAENWNYFGDAYGTLNAWCLDGEGNIHQTNSTDQESTLKIKVFYDPDFINPHTTTSNPTPNCFYYWQEAYFGGVGNLVYSPTESYAATQPLSPFGINYGDASNLFFNTPFSHYDNLNSISDPYITPEPYYRYSADEKCKVDLFYSLITHELQHRSDFQTPLTPDEDTWVRFEYYISDLNGLGQSYDPLIQNWIDYTDSPYNISNYEWCDGLNNNIDPFPDVTNGAWKIIGNQYGVYCNEYRNWANINNSKYYTLWMGDFEHRARGVEDVNAPEEKDWSKGGKQW